MKKLIPPSVILNNVAVFYKMSVEQMLARCRKKELVLARQVTADMLTEYTNLSPQQIGACMMRDRTTYLHSIQTIRDRYDTDDSIRQDINQLSWKFNNY